MARVQKEATIILLDVGENTLVSSGKDGKSFFARAKECVSKIIQKKIFAKPNDEIALILMGSDETINDLNRSMKEGFENIVEKIPLQMPTWEMVRTLNELRPSEFSSEWVDGLVVALNYAKLETQAKKFVNVRILLLTNFITETSDSNFDVVINAIKDEQIEVLAISDCVEHSEQLKSSQFSQNPSVTNNQAYSQKLFVNVMEQVGGQLCHIDLAETQLLTFQKKKTRPMPWNATLTIGSEMKIDVSAYVSVQEEKFLSSFKTECTNPNTITKSVTEYAMNNQQIAKPDVEDVIKSYMYGSSLVPIEDDGFKDTDKCFSCLGFSRRSNVLNEFLTGTGCHIVLPQKNRTRSAVLFASLVDSMKKMDMVMIARKVYRNGLKPIIVALLPHVEDNISFMTMVQLSFANDFSLFSFPRLASKKTEPSAEQARVVKELVDAMDLMSAIDDDSGLSEAFALNISLNPVNQHLCRSVAFRALHPSDPLPTIDAELVAMIDVPPKLKEASAGIVKEIEEKFPLELVERRVKKVFGKSGTDALPSDDATDADTTDIDNGKIVVAVGTVTPAEDFDYLLKKGERFGRIVEQMQTVIHDLLFRTASVQTEKILECLMMFREQSKVYGPFSYNNWLKEFKNTVVQRNRLQFWQDSIVKEGFGLITINESPISTVTIEQQLEFYEVTSKDVSMSVSMDVGDDDELDALLG